MIGLNNSFFCCILLLLFGCEQKEILKGKWLIIESKVGGFTQKNEVGDSGDFLVLMDSVGYYTSEINNRKLRKEKGKNVIPDNDTIIYKDTIVYLYANGLFVEKWNTKYGPAEDRYSVVFRDDSLFLKCLSCTIPSEMVLIRRNN